MIMYHFNPPYGFINYKCIRGITQTKRGYYIVDDAFNFLRCDDKTFNDLKDRGYPLIDTKRKGV